MTRKKKKSGCGKLSERDLGIIDYLRFGPSTYSSISRRFFPREDANDRSLDGTKWVDTPSGYAVTRLRQLRDQGYIQAAGLGRERTMIVALKKAGAKIAVAELGAELDNITCELPPQDELEHSIMVAATLRKIALLESSVQRAYDINWYRTARYLRRNDHNDKKKIYVPDFIISLKTVTSDKKLFNIIIDDWGTGRAVFFDKISSFEYGDTIIMASQTDRLRLLFNNLLDDKQSRAVGAKGKIRRLHNRIFFVEWEDFARHGFTRATFHAFPEWDRIDAPIKF